MDKLNIPQPSNGYPFNWDDLAFALGTRTFTGGIIQSIEAILLQLGTDFIVQGVEVSGSAVTEGWVMLDGVLTKVDAHTVTGNYFELVQTYNASGNKQTQLGGLVDTYQENRAVASASSGTLINPVTGDPDRLADVMNENNNIYLNDYFENIQASGTYVYTIPNTVGLFYTEDTYLGIQHTYRLPEISKKNKGKDIHVQYYLQSGVTSTNYLIINDYSTSLVWRLDWLNADIKQGSLIFRNNGTTWGVLSHAY